MLATHTIFSTRSLISWGSNGPTNFTWDLHNDKYDKNYNNEFVRNKITKNISEKRTKD